MTKITLLIRFGCCAGLAMGLASCGGNSTSEPTNSMNGAAPTVEQATPLLPGDTGSRFKCTDIVEFGGGGFRIVTSDDRSKDPCTGIWRHPSLLRSNQSRRLQRRLRPLGPERAKQAANRSTNSNAALPIPPTPGSMSDASLTAKGPPARSISKCPLPCTRRSRAAKSNSLPVVTRYFASMMFKAQRPNI